MKFAICAFLAWSCSGLQAGGLPDPLVTPGAVNPDVNPDTMASTICVAGYTKAIRPPAKYTDRLKQQQIALYGYADRDPRHYEEDHLIALSIGGASADANNLWPQPREGLWTAREKDQLEGVLHRMVCAGQLPLRQAQQAMAKDWIATYQRYVGDR
ncbi:MAG: hypothetical protein WCK81_02640 [Betaproteobacteria bacterium]